MPTYWKSLAALLDKATACAICPGSRDQYRARARCGSALSGRSPGPARWLPSGCPQSRSLAVPVRGPVDVTSGRCIRCVLSGLVSFAVYAAYCFLLCDYRSRLTKRGGALQRGGEYRAGQRDFQKSLKASARWYEAGRPVRRVEALSQCEWRALPYVKRPKPDHRVSRLI